MKILCVLYDDPKGGMPESYPLTDLPKLEKYPDGMTLPSPNQAVDPRMPTSSLRTTIVTIQP